MIYDEDVGKFFFLGFFPVINIFSLLVIVGVLLE